MKTRIPVLGNKNIVNLCYRALVLSIVVFVSACAEFPRIATQKDVLEVKESVLKMEKNMDDIKRNQAEQGIRLDELNGNVLSIIGSMDMLVNTLSKKIENLERKLSGGKTTPGSAANEAKPSSEQPSAAKEIYALAYQDYVKGNYALSIMGFDELIKRYPDDQLALGAKYWKGENYLSQEKFDDAISEFDGVILSSGSGDTDEARKAKFKKALIYIKLSQNDKAISLFDEIIKKYPLTQEAVQAKEKKASLSNQ